MEINQAANVDTSCLTTATCTDPVQREVQAKMLKESMDVEKAMMSRLLQSMGIGRHVDTVA